VHACTGSASAAQVADAAASTLEAELGHPDDDIVVAIDGCSVACARRSLEARGLAPLSVTLEELGVPADEPIDPGRLDAVLAEATERLKTQAAANQRRARLKRASVRPRVTGSTRQGHSVEDYLHVIHLLTSPVAACGAVVADWPTASARVAQSLSVTRATAGEALARLETAGLIMRGPAKEVLLTEAGRVAAEDAIHRHRLVERFLVDQLGCTPAESFALALDVRDGLPEAIVERLERRAPSDARCPHGWPLDPSRDRELAATLVAVSTLPPGAKSVVVALVEHDADVLARLFAHGAAPGTELEVVEQEPAGTTVAIDGNVRLLEADEAAALLVKAN
jgi:Mn-dependent DtxR family transcriptional regulator/uncharacterized metal-binding protein